MGFRQLEKTHERFLKKFNSFEKKHPATYTYMMNGNGNNAPYKLVEYAVDKGGDILRYKQALSHVEDGARNRPFDTKSSEYHVVKKLLELDNYAYVNEITPQIAKGVSKLYLNTKNAQGVDGMEKSICVEAGMSLIASTTLPAKNNNISELGEDSIRRLFTSVNNKEKYEEMFGDEEEDETREEMDVEDETDEEVEDDEPSTITPGSYWRNDDEMMVWMYAQFTDQQDIARRLVDTNPQTLDKYNELNTILSRPGDNLTSLATSIDTSEHIRLTQKQDRILSELQELVSDIDDKRQALIELVNQRTGFQIVEDTGEGDDLEEDSYSMIEVGDEDETEDWLDDYDAPQDPADYDASEVPSTLMRDA